MITRIGITGAAGHIGRTLTEGLSDSYTLTLFDRRDIEQVPSRRCKSVRVDFSRTKEVKGIFEGLDAVIHLAADACTRAPWQSILNNNIVATYNIFEEARRAGLAKIVFASSNHTQLGHAMRETPGTLDPSYVQRKGHISLNDTPAPDSLYGVSKLFGENIGWYYARMFGIQFVGLRIGWTFPEDEPSIKRGTASEDLVRAMFLSKRDCVQAFTRALQVDTDYLLAYAISDNDQRVFDLTETRERLGFRPKDNAQAYF